MVYPTLQEIPSRHGQEYPARHLPPEARGEVRVHVCYVGPRTESAQGIVGATGLVPYGLRCGGQQFPPFPSLL